MVVRPLHVSTSTIESVDNSLAAHVAGSSQPAEKASGKKRIEDMSSEDCEHNHYTLIALNTELMQRSFLFS